MQTHFPNYFPSFSRHIGAPPKKKKIKTVSSPPKKNKDTCSLYKAIVRRIKHKESQGQVFARFLAQMSTRTPRSPRSPTTAQAYHQSSKPTAQATSRTLPLTRSAAAAGSRGISAQWCTAPQCSAIRGALRA